MDAAAAHEIVLSAAAGEGLDLAAVDDIGSRKFKNVPEAVACYRARGRSPMG